MIIGHSLGGHYQIIKLLGEGAFGETYLAKDTHLPKEPLRVVKKLQPKLNDPSNLDIAKRLFETEAQTLYKLGSHKQIPQLFAHFEENQEFYLVQELIEGHDLSEEIRYGKKLLESKVIELLRGILETLVFVHQQKVIHRDIKPSNLMRRTSDDKIVIIDFGAVKQINTSFNAQKGQKQKTVAIGTPGYMPIEQASGHPKLCSDIYAVGMIGIQALTGVFPLQLLSDPNTLEVIWQDNITVSPELATVLNKMVRYNFSERYKSPVEVLEVLNGFFNPPTFSPSNYPTLPVQPKLKMWIILSLGIAVLTLVSLPLLSRLGSQSTPKPSPTRNIQW